MTMRKALAYYDAMLESTKPYAWALRLSPEEMIELSRKIIEVASKSYNNKEFNDVFDKKPLYDMANLYHEIENDDLYKNKIYEYSSYPNKSYYNKD